jgi:hypothetical protein
LWTRCGRPRLDFQVAPFPVAGFGLFAFGEATGPSSAVKLALSMKVRTSGGQMCVLHVPPVVQFGAMHCRRHGGVAHDRFGRWCCADVLVHRCVSPAQTARASSLFQSCPVSCAARTSYLKGTAGVWCAIVINSSSPPRAPPPSLPGLVGPLPYPFPLPRPSPTPTLTRGPPQLC